MTIKLFVLYGQLLDSLSSLWIRVVSPRKVSRFAPLNRYYIIIDEVFFDNFLVIIYLLVVCKKNIIHSFWSTLIIYSLVAYKKKWYFIHFGLLLSKISSETFLAKFTKNHTRTVKSFFFVPTQKCMKWLRCCTSAQITSFLMNYASNAKIV